MRLQNGIIIREVEEQISPMFVQRDLLTLRAKRQRLRQKMENHKTYDAELAAEENRLIAMLNAVGLTPAVLAEPPADHDVDPLLNVVPDQYIGRRGRIQPPSIEEMTSKPGNPPQP